MASNTAPKKAPPKAKKPATAGKGAGVAVPGKPISASQRMAKYGEDRVVADLAEGSSLTDLARGICVSKGVLLTWIAADPDRSARAREARTHAARLWDEKAIEVIELAGDPFELSRAKELAHHYRWRASKTAPREYGEKIQAEHTGANGGAIEVRSTVRLVRAPDRTEDAA